MLTRRDFLFRTAGALALAAIPGPLQTLRGPNARPATIPSPVGETVAYRHTDDVILAQLHQDFPQYAFFLTPVIFDPNDFCPRRGIFARGPVTGGLTRKLKVVFSPDFADDLAAVHGINAGDELYKVMRHEIVLEFEHQRYRRLWRGKYVHPQFADAVQESILNHHFTFPYFT